MTTLTLAELREEIRETIFEDDLRDVGEEEPRWEELIEVLGEAGVDADEDTLEALPFVIELDDDVARRVTPSPAEVEQDVERLGAHFDDTWYVPIIPAAMWDSTWQW